MGLHLHFIEKESGEDNYYYGDIFFDVATVIHLNSPMGSFIGQLSWYFLTDNFGGVTIDIRVYSNIMIEIKILMVVEGEGMDMEKYSVNQVARELNIPKDTLRYYDKLNLVSPERGENHYRYYTRENLMDLMYVQVMKYAGFSLSEAGKVISNKRNKVEEPACRENTIRLLQVKKEETIKKIEHFNKIIKLIDTSVEIVKNKKPHGNKNAEDVNKLILSIFNDIKE